MGKKHTMFGSTLIYAQIHDDDFVEETLHNCNEEMIDKNGVQHQVTESAHSTASSVEYLDSAREQCMLFQAVLRGIESGKSPESNDLLDLLRLGLTRAQTDLHSCIATAQHEAVLMECLAVNDLIDTSLAEYQTAVEQYQSPISSSETQMETSTEPSETNEPSDS